MPETGLSNSQMLVVKTKASMRCKRKDKESVPAIGKLTKY